MAPVYVLGLGERPAARGGDVDALVVYTDGALRLEDAPEVAGALREYQASVATPGRMG